MDQGDLARRIEGLDSAQCLELVQHLVSSGQVSAAQLQEFVRSQAQPVQGREAVPQPTPEEVGLASRTVWIFTSYAISALAIAGVVAYLISQHVR